MNPSHNSDAARKSAGLELGHSQASSSVPISVYRELAAELQATKAMVDSLGMQNNHLNRQNQLLRQEIHHMVQVAVQLGHHAGIAQPYEGEMPTAPPATGQSIQVTEPAAPAPAQRPPQRPTRQQTPTKLFTEQDGERRRYRLESKPSRDLSSLWLILSILVIILTAFGAGFLIMRPLLNDR